MASYTTNLNLKKPAQSDKIRIADINGNMDDIDAAFGAVGSVSVATQLGDIREGLAIVSTGNTHGAIAAGQFVYVMNHSTLSDGLYTANSALAANATLSSSNVTAVSTGGLNALLNNMIPQTVTVTRESGASSTEFYVNAVRVGNICIVSGYGEATGHAMWTDYVLATLSVSSSMSIFALSRNNEGEIATIQMNGNSVVFRPLANSLSSNGFRFEVIFPISVS